MNRNLPLISLLLACLMSCTSAFSQYSEVNIKARTETSISKEIPANCVVNINSFTCEFNETSYLIDMHFGLSDGRSFTLSEKKVKNLIFLTEDVQDLWDKYIISDVIPSITNSVTTSSTTPDIYQYSLRQELEVDALRYISIIKENGLEFEDPYLENYLYSLVAKIAPKYMLDGRPSNVNIVIEQNPSANACCFPNGTIVINTGLLSALHTEDELVAILSHEIAHFVLDHAVKNINESVKRQKRAEFWAGLATIATAVTEGVIASNNQYYIPGSATVAVAAMSSIIASNVTEQLGMRYNHLQEKEADKLAKEVLLLLGYNENALATALSRIERIFIEERNLAMNFDSESHPSLIERIKLAGTPSNEVNVQFERIISFATTNTAMLKYNNRRFRQCLPLVNQNINNGVALADDYIIKAQCLLALEDHPETNREILELLSKAKELNANNINIDKVEIISNLRLGNNELAIQMLTEYIEQLSQMDEELSYIYNQDMWAATKQFIISEKQWAQNMIIKIKGMIGCYASNS